ncbi:DUF5666 domain-containing protein [Mycolicibacterium madagascariense]|nr:DUF5666 domain-containing protein [Mycolicibacterium madagascariense]MCV7013273.1 hypothetical protein [Mycolicibacterium madagascariense]
MLTSTLVSRCGAVAFAGAAVVALAACGSSSTPSASSSASSAKPSSSSAAASPSSAPMAQAKDRIAGIVGSVAGGKVTLTGPDGPGPVDVGPTTHVTQLTTAQLTDIAVGQCLVARPTKETQGTPNVTAAAILFGPADNNGQCAPPGRKGGRGIIGTVASINGNAITVTGSDNTTSTVTVASNTRFAKRNVVDPSAIAAGECLIAQGTKAGDGSLQATSIGLKPADSGPCGRRQGS